MLSKHLCGPGIVNTPFGLGLPDRVDLHIQSMGGISVEDSVKGVLKCMARIGPRLEVSSTIMTSGFHGDVLFSLVAPDACLR